VDIAFDTDADRADMTGELLTRLAPRGPFSRGAAMLSSLLLADS
jgi:hypothetical protein